MRGKWAFTGVAVLALVVVGGVGGVTMRAFAGTAQTKIVTKNVTKFCVYVDHTNGGDSYGDVSTLPKYMNRTCIVGKRGPVGDSSVISWNKTVASGAPPAAKRSKDGFAGNTVDLAKVGPFTVRGYCSAPEGVEAMTRVVSAQDGSSFTWNDNSYPTTFNSGSTLQASNPADGSSQAPAFANESNEGDFSVSTNDQKTAFTGFATNGVYIQGASGPACSFTGYLVLEKPSS